MAFAKILVPVSLIALVATAAAAGCTAQTDDAAARTDAARSQLKPPGNNGTVKIQESTATDEIPDNDPHVGCNFKIEFRGFDEGDYRASWTLLAQPPSGPFVPLTTAEVFIGEDAAGGANDLDATVNVDLSTIELSSLYEHPQQGFHLKLEVHAEGSQGADTKFKVFWVEGCGVETTSSSSSSSGSTPGPVKTW
jgi:hypothetical protein